MSQFKENLKKNNFICSYCEKCERVVWPPSDLCNRCFSQVTWKNLDRKAKLIELIKKDGEQICIAEFKSGIRIMGTLLHGENLKVGDFLNLVKCDYEKTEKYFFEPLS